MMDGQEEHHYANLNIIQQSIREKKLEPANGSRASSWNDAGDTSPAADLGYVSQPGDTPPAADLGYISQPGDTPPAADLGCVSQPGDTPPAADLGCVSQPGDTPPAADLGCVSQQEPGAVSSRCSTPVSLLPSGDADDYMSCVSSLSYQSCLSLKSPTPRPRSCLSLSRVRSPASYASDVEDGAAEIRHSLRSALINKEGVVNVGGDNLTSGTSSQEAGGKIGNLVQKFEQEADSSTRYLTFKKDETFSRFLRKHLAHFQNLEHETARKCLEFRPSPENSNVKVTAPDAAETNDEVRLQEKTSAIDHCNVSDTHEVENAAKINCDNNNINVGADDVTRNKPDHSDNVSLDETLKSDESRKVPSSCDEEECLDNGSPLQNQSNCSYEKSEFVTHHNSLTQKHVLNGFANVVKDLNNLLEKDQVPESNDRIDNVVKNDPDSYVSISNHFSNQASTNTGNMEKNNSDNFKLRAEETLKNSFSFLSTYQQNQSNLHSLESLQSATHSRSSSASSMCHSNQRLLENEVVSESCCLKRESSTSSTECPKEIALDRRIPIFRKKVSKFLPANIHQRTSSDSSLESYKAPEKGVTTFKQIAADSEKSRNELTTFRGKDLPHTSASSSLSLIDLYRKSELESSNHSTESCASADKSAESDGREETKSESDPSSQFSSESFDPSCRTCLNCDRVDSTSQSEDDNNNDCSYFLRESTHQPPPLQSAEVCHVARAASSPVAPPGSKRSCATLNCRQFKQRGGACHCAHYKPCSKHCYEKKINRRQRKNFESFVEPQLFQVQHIVTADVAGKMQATPEEKTFSTFKPVEESARPAGEGEHIYMNVKMPQNEKFLVTSAGGDVFPPVGPGDPVRAREKFDAEQTRARDVSESCIVTRTFLQKLGSSPLCGHCRQGSGGGGSPPQPRQSCAAPKRKTIGCGQQPHKLSQLCVGELVKHDPQIFSLTSSSGVHRRQDLGQNGLEDMIQLSDLNEASLLWNLKIRYDKELIYTYVGSILVAVNPYKMYDMYGLDMVKKYEGQILGTLSPHLFAIGSAAYSALAATGSQVVVISGESGSGKTECTKLVMQYLAAVNKSPSNLVTEQILEASPLLESFGNAKTVRNDNSSRFGKFLQVHFKDGVILGAKVTEYLLEKSRIVTQAPEERNYHVFYELLSGLSDDTKLKYGLLSPDKYFYLNQGGNCEIDGKYDGEDFQSLMSAMQVLGFTSEEQDTIFRILASVLHLGNVYFHRKQLKHGQEGVEIGSDAEIRWTGHLLKLEADGIQQALTTKTTEARNERLLTALTIDQALDTRDAFAKALYSSLFGWLVARINHIVYKGTKKTAAISILDIFGFEDFKENSFEQLCINYANENLQFYFNKHIFKLEQQEYIKEKISWQNITFTDNIPVIHLLSKKPVGILHLLDDESNFPKATDVSFLEKCHYNHALNEFYSRPRLTGPEFGVKHYAGPVWYNVEGFLDKNRDTLRPDVVELLISSSLPMLSKMFSALRSRDEASKTLNKANGRFVTMKPRTPTVAARFHDSLSQLLDSMAKCRPWFVRCVKPNAEKAPMRFDMPTVLEQLRYSGMLETIRIRKLGYPVRLKFAAFIERYRYLLPHQATPSRGAPLREICNLVLSGYPGEYQLGVSRVFLRETVERTLERRRAAVLQSAAVHIQRHIRGLLCRKQYAVMRRSAVTIQAAVRGWRERRRYAALRRGVTRAQAQFRGRRQRLRYQRLREELKRRSAAAHQKEQQRKAAPPPLSRDDSGAHEKVARSSSGGVAQLDIPAELAFIWNKLDGWTPPHVDRNLVKVVGPVVEAPGPGLGLPQDIDQHAFSKFSNIYFKSHVWGMKRDPIKTPFLNKHKDSDFADSLAIFKLILRFMNDDTLTGKKEQALGDYIAYKGLANEKLRDEILCQLVNQTWRNDSAASCERGWLLLANCLSVFPPSAPLYKFLLKYVSDHGYNGYKQLCQRKLLRSHNQAARVHVPSLLEWRANRKRTNMAVQLNFADGEWLMAGVDSWSRCESLCAAALAERGVAETRGWTLSLERGMAGGKAAPDQRNGLDYVLDAVAEMETSPHFPTAQRGHASLGQSAERASKMSSMEAEPISRRPTVPPPQPPPSAKMMKEKARSVSRDEPLGLSRQSALNDRYFDPGTTPSAPSGNNKQSGGRSRSLDNLLTPMSIGMPSKLETMGLSKSRLNDRYHSMERIQESVLTEDAEAKKQMEDEDIMESVSQRGENRKYSLTGESSDNMIINNQLDFDYPDVGGNRSEDDRSYIRGHPRFIKSQYAGKRAPPGSHSSKAQIETRHSDNKSEGAKSSAMSDTSEAPSLASHVRRVRVPSQASDVDQFLDDLFSPVLDQLSDARSLAASIKGGGKGVATQQNGQAQSPPGGSFSFNPLVGGSSPVMSGLMPPQPLLIPSLPVYNAQGMSLPAGPPTPTPTPQADSPSMLAYQANLQQAFLQSAMAQNIQIQQQLFAQNQALQQLLQQRVSVTEPPAPWHGSPTSPVNPSKSSPPSKPQGGSTAHASFTSVLSELKSRRSSSDEDGSAPPAPPAPLLLHRSTSLGGGAAPPPPPPMPPPPDLADPSEGRPFMDPYGRAKTVRIGKWRWPPPQGDSGDSSFLAFKLKQQRRKHSQEIGDPPENGVVEWEEFEMQSESQGPVSMATSTPNLNNNTSTEVHRGSYKSLEVGAARPSPGSVGKLRISSEMKHKLEMVTANHSLRSTDGKNQRSALPPANKLDSDRRLLLQQQLAGRWGSMDSVDARAVVKEDRSDVQATNIVRSQVDKVWRGAPPPPVVPGGGGGLNPNSSSNGVGGQHNPPSRSSSFYDSHAAPPPAPITPRHPSYQGAPEHHHHHNHNNHHGNHHHNHHVEDQAEFSPVPQESNPQPSPSSNIPPSVPAPHHPHPSSGTDVSKTILYPPLASAYFAYNRVTWKLNVRKEVFSPKETVSSPLVLHLVFCQIVADTLTQPSPRISPEERSEMMQLLEQYGVTMSNMHTGQHKASTKRAVLDMARHWLMYFATIFSISGGHQYPDVQLVAIAHSGIRLGRLDLNHLRVLHNISLEDISESVMSKTGSSLQVVLQSGEKFPIHSPRARQIHTLLHAFIVEGGAVVQMQQESRLTKQWLNENHHAHENRPSQHSPLHLSHPPQQHRKASLTHSPTPTPMIEDDGKHSLLQFAMHHFRQFENMKSANGELTVGGSGRKKSSNDWTWREQLDLVKFTCVPISEPLLRLEPPLAEIAVECFECIMRFMGDLPTTPDLTEVKCVYTILMHCHTHEPLRDEVYSQLMKQTTSNKTESCQRGWRLLSIVAAYFTCSETLRPFLLKYLETAAYDKRRAFHGTASVCLQNLRKTLRYGGRKNVPSVEEVTAVSAGRNSKRQLYRLPGGSETVINTKSTTVVEDICIEMCQLINVSNDLEMEEFSLYCIVEGDAFTMPLAKEEYILDVTTELHKNQQVFYLIFCRSVWYFPLRLDCQLYVQVLFNQIAPDYLEGLLLVLPNEQIPHDTVYDVAKLAALLHRAADMSHPPAMKETKFLLPKPALTQRDIKPATWVQMVQGHWSQVAGLHSIQAKAQLLELLSKWPLFGSSFFAIRRGADQQILALNRRGVHFLHLLTHEPLGAVPYSDVISTRKVRAEGGTLYLELKCGNLFQQRVARIQTDQAHEIARLIRQYMSLDRQKNAIQ